MRRIYQLMAFVAVIGYGVAYLGSHHPELVTEAVQSTSSFVRSAKAGTSGSMTLVTDEPSLSVAFSPGNAEGLVVETIDGAQKSLRVAAYSFTSKPIAKALVAAEKRGVDVQVVLDKSQQSERYTSATFIAHAGIPVRINSRYAIMHNKFIVVDGATVETGSFNYTRSAQARNAENVVVIRQQPRFAATYTEEWNRLWNEAEPYQQAR